MKRLAAATPEEIATVPGIGPRVAAAVAVALGGERADARSDRGQGPRAAD